jgi:amino acid transporter
MIFIHRNLWLSIVLALPSVIVLYLLTNISYFTVMNKAALLSSNAVAVVCRCLVTNNNRMIRIDLTFKTWGHAVLGPVVRILPIFISISALGSANASLFGAARYCMVSAQYGYLPEVFACIHKKRLTPISGVVFEVINFDGHHSIKQSSQFI